MSIKEVFQPLTQDTTFEWKLVSEFVENGDPKGRLLFRATKGTCSYCPIEAMYELKGITSRLHIEEVMKNLDLSEEEIIKVVWLSDDKRNFRLKYAEDWQELKKIVGFTENL